MIARVLEFLGHAGLRVRGQLAGNLGGVLDGFLQGRGKAVEPLGNAFGDGFQLAGALGLGRGHGLQVAPQFVHLGFESFVFLAALQTLQSQPEDCQGHHDRYADEDSSHWFSKVMTGNGSFTLAEVESRRLKVEKEKQREPEAIKR